MRVAASTAPAPNRIRFVFGLARPLGGSSKSSSSVIFGTLAAFSNPTSISMLIVSPVSLGVNFFHLPNGPCKIRPRLIEPVERGNLVVVRARERILRLNNLDVVGHSGLEPVARLIHFFFRQLNSQIRHLHFA